MPEKELVHANVQCFLTLLEVIRARPVKRVVYASSAAVYGAGAGSPFSEGCVHVGSQVYLCYCFLPDSPFSKPILSASHEDLHPPPPHHRKTRAVAPIPKSVYAATKLSSELLAAAYAKRHNIPMVRRGLYFLL
jgi:nucleoside-diphosphate-sugar epimerase